jgi:hypothetical protein
VNSINGRSSQETPIHCKVVYRRISEPDGVAGEGISFSGGGIQFRGALPLRIAEAAEVHIDAVKGLSPPLTAYIEVSRCDREDSGNYRISGVIKGIRSE